MKLFYLCSFFCMLWCSFFDPLMTMYASGYGPASPSDIADKILSPISNSFEPINSIE